MALSMERWKGKVAIVAGASSGIGAQTVVQLLNEGIIVVGMARRKEKIQQLSTSPNLHALRVDVTKEEDVVDAFKWVKDNLGPIHIHVNSVGALGDLPFGNLRDGDMQEWKNKIDIEFLGLCLCTREAIKNMQENSVDGHIIHVIGVSGHYANNSAVGVHSGCKAGIVQLTETLRKELLSIGSKIKISSVSPGLVETEIFTRDYPENPAFQRLAEGFRKSNFYIQPNEVVDAMIYMLSTPPHVQVHNIIIRAVGSPY